MKRHVTVAAFMILAAIGGGAAAELQTVEYHGSFAILGPWPAPDPEIRLESYEWFSYLVAPNTPIRLQGKYQQAHSGLLPMRRHPGDLDCDQVSGPIYVGSSDPNGFDGDGDGIGCE